MKIRSKIGTRKETKKNKGKVKGNEIKNWKRKEEGRRKKPGLRDKKMKRKEERKCKREWN